MGLHGVQSGFQGNIMGSHDLVGNVDDSMGFSGGLWECIITLAGRTEGVAVLQFSSFSGSVESSSLTADCFLFGSTWRSFSSSLDRSYS